MLSNHESKESKEEVVDIDTDEEKPSTFFGNFIKISKLALPMGLSFTFSFEVFITTVLLNQLSNTDNETASITLSSTLMNTLCILGVSPLFSVAFYLSNKLGKLQKMEKNDDPGSEYQILKEDIASINPNTLLIASILTIPTFLAMCFPKPLLVSVFGQNEDVADIAQNFLRAYSFAAPALLSRMTFEQIMFAFKKTEPAMWIGLFNLTIGSAIAALLGFGPQIGSLQIPKLGSSGVAIGFVTEAYLTALSYGLYIGLHKDCQEFKFFSRMIDRIKVNFNQIKDILKIGGAISFTIALELAMTLSIGTLSGLVSTNSQSAMAYIMQFMYFEFIMLAAFSMTCTQEMGREIGAKHYLTASKLGKDGLLTTLIYLTPLPLIFASDPQILVNISGGASKEISVTLNQLVPIMSTGVMVDTIRYNLLQQSRSLNDLFTPNLIAFVGMTIGILSAALLGLRSPLGVDGVAAGYTAGITLTALGLLFQWKNKIQPSEIKASVERRATHTDQPETSWSFSSIRSSISNRFSFFKSKPENHSPELSDPLLPTPINANTSNRSRR